MSTDFHELIEMVPRLGATIEALADLLERLVSADVDEIPLLREEAAESVRRIIWCCSGATVAAHLAPSLSAELISLGEALLSEIDKVVLLRRAQLASQWPGELFPNRALSAGAASVRPGAPRA
jgi:hypothetical protein